VRAHRARTVVSGLATFPLSTACRQLPSFLLLFFGFRRLGVFGAFGGAVGFVSLVASFVAPARLGSLPFVVCVLRLRCGVWRCVLLLCFWRLRAFGVSCPVRRASLPLVLSCRVPPSGGVWCVSRRASVRFARGFGGSFVL
jgi:hypothetical protein